MNAFTIKAKTVGGNWIDTLGATVVEGATHHGVSYATREAAATAAKVAHPDMSAQDLLIVGPNGEQSTVAAIVYAADLGAQVVDYCRSKTLSLGGLVDRIQAAGSINREMADAVIVYCQENSLTLGGLVSTLASYSNEVADILEHGHVTFKNAYAWLASQEQYTFCIDLLEISAHDADADTKVNALENSFVELIRKADAATDTAI